MGNVLSEEEQEEQFLEDGFNLESPDADKVINYGTAAPVWQNKKSTSSRSLENGNDSSHPSNRDRNMDTTESTTNSEPPRRSASSNHDEGTTNSVQNNANNNNNNSSHKSRSNNTASAMEETQSDPDEPPKKLSYIQMAKLGYQELINAIIRPPRADYKVRLRKGTTNFVAFIITGIISAHSELCRLYTIYILPLDDR
jgi:hypothetical protein